MAAGLRLPLYPAEARAAPTTVVVTGATGFLAGPLVARLLVAGHTVHATVRDPERNTEQLKALPNAGSHLKLFKADLTKPGSFDEAVRGATFVFHTASPFVLKPARGAERELLVEPAVKGTENIIDAVNKSPSVRRLVLTSSYYAVTADADDREKGHVFQEDEWNESSSETVNPYAYSKTVAEKRAWELSKQQSRWDLVTILPAAVYGPPINLRGEAESTKRIKSLLDGDLWPAVPPFYLPVVDVDDVAALHILAAVTPSASGRYLATPEVLSMKQHGDVLREKYPKRRLPRFGYVPYYAVLALAPALGLRRDFVRTAYGKPWTFNASRAERQLGIKWTPAKKAIQDMAAAMLEMGIAK